MSRAGDDYGTGDTLADFHNNGMIPSWIEALQMDANGRDREVEFSRRNQGEISSGLAADWDFTDISAFSTSSIEIKKSGGTSSTAMGDHENGGRVLPTATNFSLTKLARAHPE